MVRWLGEGLGCFLLLRDVGVSLICTRSQFNLYIQTFICKVVTPNCVTLEYRSGRGKRLHGFLSFRVDV